MRLRLAHERGHANHGWLDAHHTFSFADYRDPEWVQFGPMRVLNQDRVQPGTGFGRHGHREMEIVTYIIEGAIEHQDSMGNKVRMERGEVQRMTAGTGVEHSEFNASDEQVLELLQIWFHPRTSGREPGYQQKSFTKELDSHSSCLVVNPEGTDGSLTIDQDVKIYASRWSAGGSLEHRIEDGRMVWLHLARGRASVNGKELNGGDGAGIEEAGTLVIEAGGTAEFLIFDMGNPQGTETD